jgi:hypothetical protein
MQAYTSYNTQQRQVIPPQLAWCRQGMHLQHSAASWGFDSSCKSIGCKTVHAHFLTKVRPGSEYATCICKATMLCQLNNCMYKPQKLFAVLGPRWTRAVLCETAEQADVRLFGTVLNSNSATQLQLLNNGTTDSQPSLAACWDFCSNFTGTCKPPIIGSMMLQCCHTQPLPLHSLHTATATALSAARKRCLAHSAWQQCTSMQTQGVNTMQLFASNRCTNVQCLVP